MKQLLLFIIEIYQKTISPDHGWMKIRHPFGHCRFYPSCSEYTRQAILNSGTVKGSYLGIKRIIKCNPFTQPAIDLPPYSLKPSVEKN